MKKKAHEQTFIAQRAEEQKQIRQHLPTRVVDGKQHRRPFGSEKAAVVFNFSVG